MSQGGLPRAIPARIWLSLYLRSPLIVIGIFLVLFGALFLVVAESMTDFRSTMQFREGDPVTTGVVINKEKTGTFSGGRRRGYYIFRYHFSYVVGSSSYQGTSFARDIGLVSGNKVDVAYVRGKPDIARIRGMEAGSAVNTGLWLALGSMAIVAAGMALLFFGAKKARKYIHLVRHGVFTTGTVTGKVATETSFGGKRVYEIHFQFKDRSGRTCAACLNTHETDRLEDQPLEPILYDALNPSNAILVDALPTNLRVLMPQS